MATGTVSSITYDNWQLVATNSITSGSSSSFSCSGFKRLMFSWTGVSSTNQHIYLTLNGSTSGYAGGAWINEYNGQFAQTTSRLYLSGISSDSHDGCITIEDTLSAAPKRMIGFGNDNGYTTSIGGSWNNTAAVTSLVFQTGGTFSAGSISLYGLVG